jgi:hypothetical protein
MSDNWIILIPEDPRFVPEKKKQSRARDRFKEIAPEADEVKWELHKRIEFFDCGGNFERVLCPSCRAELSEWWQARVDEDYKDGFALNAYPTPCCGAQFTMHDLHYEWPQGVGRCGLSAMNPGIGRLGDTYKLELEAILGTKLRVIYRRL